MQASPATPPAAFAGGNPLWPATSRQRVYFTPWHTPQYVNPQQKYITKTLQTVGANKSAAYVARLRALELGTAATLQDMPLGSSTGPDPRSTAVGPTEGSAGGPAGQSTFDNIAAVSAAASGEDNAPSLDHLDDAISGQEPRLGELRPAGVLMHFSKTVPLSLVLSRYACCVLQGATLHQLAAVVC